MTAYRCDHCETTFEPAKDEDQDGQLIVAGWRPVWIRVFFDFNSERERHIFSRGGWMCPACVKQLTEPGRIRPARRRRRRTEAA